MRNQIAAANWKMNLTWPEGEALVTELIQSGHSLQTHQQVVLAVPFPYLPLVQKRISDTSNFFIGAQNCSDRKSGAFTGEVSASMLQSVGTTYVIIGHSERREYFNENNKMLADKINLCLASGLKPIFCCGEPLPVREKELQNQFVHTQLVESLFHLQPAELSELVIAYEPIWAIGTGQTASAAQVQEMHLYIRTVMFEKYGEQANSIPILYGGSVKGANAAEIFSQPDVDGGLIGGASLQAAEFITIIKNLK